MNAKEIRACINRQVLHKPSGNRYRLTACVYRQDKRGKAVYQAELQDLSALHSIRICKLEDIEIVGDGVGND